MKRKNKVLRKPGAASMNEKAKEEIHGGPNCADEGIEFGWHKISKDLLMIDDLEGYLYNYIAEHIGKYDEYEIFIGVDSKLRMIAKGVRDVRILSTVCINKKGRGTHIIKRRESHIFKRHMSTFERLNMEIIVAEKLAKYLRGIGIEPIVHLDFNPDPKWESNKVLPIAKGIFEGQGFKVEYKPEGVAALCAADRYV